MNRFPVVTSLLMIIGFVASIFISREMADIRKNEIYKDNPTRLSELVYVPALGMDKFWADLNWIRLLQTMGNPESALKPPASNDPAAKKTAENNADYFYRQIAYISDRNPDFTLLYQVAPMYICNILPERAIELLEKGNKFSMKKDWKRYWYCSFIADRYIGAAEGATPDVAKTQLERSAKYLQTIVEGFTGYPFYIDTSFLRKKIQMKGIDPENSLAILMAEHAYFKDEVAKLRKQYEMNQPKDVPAAPGAPATPGAKGAPVAAAQPAPQPGAMPETPDMFEMGWSVAGENDSSIGRLAERIKNRCQSLALERWMGMKATTDEKQKDALKKDHAQITAIYKDVAKNEQHMSPYSLQPVQAGDIYDVMTGDRLDESLWYGFDIPYFKEKGVIVMLRGNFSPVTGRPLK